MKALIGKIMGLGTAIIDWNSTIKLLALRSAAGGFVWGLIMLLATGEFSPAVLFMIFGTLIGALIYAPMGMIFAGIAKIFPPAGIVCIIPILYMVAGDPLLWIVKKSKPDFLPVDRFNFINFNTIIFVVDQDIVDTIRDGVTHEVGRAASSAVDRLSSFNKR